MQLKDTPFVDLMQKRICNVLLIANPYDAFMLEDDGRIDEKIFTEYAKLGLRFPPRFIQVSTEAEARKKMLYGDIDLVICMPAVFCMHILMALICVVVVRLVRLLRDALWRLSAPNCLMRHGMRFAAYVHYIADLCRNILMTKLKLYSV